MIAVKEELNKINNDELIKIISGNQKINVNYYPILAKRIQESILFESYLLAEISSVSNMNEIFFGFIKISWIPFLSILKYGKQSSIDKAMKLFKNWPNTEKENFLNYIKKEDQLTKYFYKKYESKNFNIEYFKKI